METETSELLPSRRLEMQRARIKALSARGMGIYDILRIEFGIDMSKAPLDLSLQFVQHLSERERYIQNIINQVDEVIKETK